MRNNLWPDFKNIDENSPKVILEEQARYLSKVTSNILYGEVSKPARFNISHFSRNDLPNSTLSIGSIPPINPNNINYSLYIVAPRLLDYRYELLSISYDPVAYYPLMAKDSFESPIKTLYSESDFISYLSSLFNNQQVSRVISKLLAQSREKKSF